MPARPKLAAATVRAGSIPAWPNASAIATRIASVAPAHPPPPAPRGAPGVTEGHGGGRAAGPEGAITGPGGGRGTGGPPHGLGGAGEPRLPLLEEGVARHQHDRLAAAGQLQSARHG